MDKSAFPKLVDAGFEDPLDLLWSVWRGRCFESVYLDETTKGWTVYTDDILGPIVT